MLTRRMFALGALAGAASLSGCMSAPTTRPFGYQPLPALAPSEPEPFSVPPTDITAIPLAYWCHLCLSPDAYAT